MLKHIRSIRVTKFLIQNFQRITLNYIDRLENTPQNNFRKKNIVLNTESN